MTIRYGTRRIETLRPHEAHPRPQAEVGIEELAESIRRQGLLSPLIVTGDGDVLCGMRRLKAAQLAGCEKVRVVERVGPLAGVLADEILVMLTEAAHQEPLSPVEEARLVERLRVECRMHPNEIAKRCGKSRRWVYARLQLLALPDEAQAALDRGDVGSSVGMLAARLPTPEAQVAFVADVASAPAPLSHREAERVFERHAGRAAGASREGVASAREAELRRLVRGLFHYATELERVVRELGGERALPGRPRTVFDRLDASGNVRSEFVG